MDAEHTRFALDSSPGSPLGDSPLRVIAWPVLCAQLAAERDLRRLLAADVAALNSPVGSFAPAVAAVLEAAAGRAVNPVALTNVKAPAGITAETGENSPPDTIGARGHQ